MDPKFCFFPFLSFVVASVQIFIGNESVATVSPHQVQEEEKQSPPFFQVQLPSPSAPSRLPPRYMAICFLFYKQGVAKPCGHHLPFISCSGSQSKLLWHKP